MQRFLLQKKKLNQWNRKSKSFQIPTLRFDNFYNKPDEFFDLLKTEQPMKISIALDSDYYSSTYLLTDVITAGFNNAWNSLNE